MRSWLSRMHLGEVLDAFEVRVEGALPGVRSSGNALEGGADGEVVNQLFEAAGELGQNVVEHAGSPVGGFIAAQRYKAGAPEERIVVAVGDAGVGIRESLRARYGDMPDGEAIRRAIQWNVSSVPDEGRGQGFRASSMASRRSTASSGSGAVSPRGR